jgi:hypothetical protein
VEKGKIHMIRKLVYTTLTITFLLVFIAGPAGVGAALAEDVPLQLPGVVEGVGTQFEVNDSEYLNVSLESSEPVSVYLSSVPSVLELWLEAADGALATGLTLSGLVPGLEYHLYTDSLENHTTGFADAAGSLAWTQDLLEPHLIFIQTVPSTHIIKDTTGGGDCVNIGTWDAFSKTCTLTADVDETIEIQSSGITLDGAGHTLTGSSSLTAGVYIPSAGLTKEHVIIKNLIIDGFANGIYLADARDCQIRGNKIMNASNNGIQLFPKGRDVVAGNIVTGNQILSSPYGIYNMRDANIFQRNTVRNTTYALDGNVLGAFYNNNLLGNQYLAQSLQGQTLSAGLPFGGNYWSSHDTPLEGCEDLNGDGFCDAPYLPVGKNGNTIGTDSYPWTEPDGWLDINIIAPVDPIMFDPAGVMIEVSATFVDVDENATHTALEWNWGDGTTSLAEVASEDGGQGEVAPAQHTYDETGVYEIKLTMTDAPYLSTVVESYKYVVIYDPSAGFVTGGGWIDSPAGAYVPDPSKVGQATFGFISKFYRTRTGENELSGSTVFEFHAGDLRYTSSSYDFLVVKNSKAIYRGLGYINGDTTKEYGFMLTAQDLDTGDMFRIQIWDGDPATGLIYDNKIGAAANDMDAGTLINDGSIIIQTNSK